MKLEKIPGSPMSKTTMPRLSIRARLMLLALLAVVPLTFDRVRLLEAGRTERIEMTSKDMLDLAKRGADAQVEMIDATRSVLAVVAPVSWPSCKRRKPGRLRISSAAARCSAGESSDAIRGSSWFSKK